MTMAVLDALYGDGAAAALAAASDMSAVFTGSTMQISEAECEDQSVAVEIRWKDSTQGNLGSCGVQFYVRSVNYSGLDVAPQYQGKGLYESLMVRHTAWLANVPGVERLEAYPATPRSEYLLSLGGFHWQPLGGALLFAACVDNDRASEWREWIEAGKPPASEPAWHAQLVANPVPGEQVF